MTILDKTKDEKLQYDPNREAEKLSSSHNSLNIIIFL